MTEIERLTKIREKLGDARRYVGQHVFDDIVDDTIHDLSDCDSETVDGLRSVLLRAIMMRLSDPDATRGAIDYARGWLAWTIGRLELDERWKVEET